MEEFQMISKKHEDLIDIEYHNGKQVRKKVDPLKEIKDELTPDKDANPFDATKAALYGDLPQADIKRDRSITARELNALAESFMKRRFESKFELRTLRMLNAPHCYIVYGKNPDGSPLWQFKWEFAKSSIVSDVKPSDGYSFEWKNPKLAKFDRSLLPEIYSKLEEHIKRKKT